MARHAKQISETTLRSHVYFGRRTLHRSDLLKQKDERTCSRASAGRAPSCNLPGKSPGFLFESNESDLGFFTRDKAIGVPTVMGPTDTLALSFLCVYYSCQNKVKERKYYCT